MELQNERMLALLSEAVASGMVHNEKEWCEKIGVYQSNLRAVKDGLRGFTLDQMVAAVRLHKTTLDWIVGLSNVKARPGANPMKVLEEAARRITEVN